MPALEHERRIPVQAIRPPPTDPDLGEVAKLRTQIASLLP